MDHNDKDSITMQGEDIGRAELPADWKWLEHQVNAYAEGFRAGFSAGRRWRE